LWMSSPHALGGDHTVFGFPIKAFGNDFLFVLGALVVISGLAGVYASAKIYLVPARPAWNTPRTPLRFFLTGFMLGPLFALVVYGVYAHLQTPGLLSPVMKAPSFAFLAISAVAGFLQLVVLLSRLFSLPWTTFDEDYASSFLLIHRFKKSFISRLALLVLGSFIFPFILTTFLQVGNLHAKGFLALGVACFLFSLFGEILGRYLFFVTVVPKNMPGAFFTTKAGAH
ncbi:MAG: hypothetical protein HYZ83_06100, partial [Candidatus Omnitrophica bacterium]|nr:hypothetical protein [Candidatus Omnitrophota bacterium]